MQSTLLTVAHDVSAALRDGLGSVRPFHSVAKAAITDTMACERLSELDLFREVAGRPLPPAIALENDFAYPTITIHRERDFRIELLFWRRGSEAYVHDHMTGGAFGIVVGRRVHVQFKFNSYLLETAPNVSAGELVVDDARVCDPGYVCEIPPGDGLIHSLYYLDNIAITLSIRQINEINTTTTGSDDAVYRAHEGHYLAALRLGAGMGLDSRKLVTFIESFLSSGDGAERLASLINEVTDHRPAAQLLAAASSASLAVHANLTDVICSAMGRRYPSLATPVNDSLLWFGDKVRFGLIDEHLDETELLFSWLLTMLCPRTMVIDILSRAMGLSLEEAEQRMLTIAGKLHMQEIDFGTGPELLIRSAPLLRTLESYGTATSTATSTSPVGPLS